MTDVRDDRLADAIDLFYEAALNPERWPAVLEAYGRAVGADGAVMLPGPAAPLAASVSEDMAEVVEAGVRDGWLAENPRIARGIQALKDPRGVITESQIFTPRELDHIPFNADYVGRHGYRWFAGLYMVAEGERSVILSAERRREREMFSHREIAQIRRAVPHLQRAGQIALRIAEARAGAALDAFETLRCGGLLLDASGTVLRMNAHAERQLGRGIAVVKGALLAQDRAANAALGRLIASAIRAGRPHEGAAEGPVAVPRPEGPPLILHAAPLAGAAQDLFQRARAVILVVDSAAGGRPGEALLRQAFGLTAAEARLARDLAEGGELAAVAAAHGITIATARSQLKAVFAKTRTHRQPELVALLGRMRL
ncbi:transcriptional regulator, LuxR family [Methylobacterium sp. 4-46]|uniref:helix-turn-helix transcriptional regulator n=1 Tax=unclassified Methylobacterium TaxID=2615210 RepID=UPI000152CC80|nr:MULTISPECIES: helix-turn-helix transcriptional regulator [Methylobacterium]ACA14627.1 transcriptional regulator, LuxR family [Methylobacterium sp. 4-46]WFT80381.1 helix-turn-helix transcriptional regulator [Methylobacterium nodulans]